MALPCLLMRNFSGILDKSGMKDATRDGVTRSHQEDQGVGAVSKIRWNLSQYHQSLSTHMLQGSKPISGNDDFVVGGNSPVFIVNWVFCEQKCSEGLFKVYNQP